MCNIAGYVGSKPAAPILLDMMRRQEGWDCGHYTGLATMDKGNLSIKKDVGSLETVFANADLSDLPGTIGFIHSRTPGGKGQGNANWAHPFVSNDRRLAYIANGYGGAFSGRNKTLARALYRELKDAGYRFDSWTRDCVGEKNRMEDGLYIHSSELKCHVVEREIDNGVAPLQALASVTMQLPSEVVMLALSLDEPDCILWSRINYPMFAGFSDHGIYLATTPQAMPSDARNITLLDALSYGRVYSDRIETYPQMDTDITVAPITPSVWKACYEAMESALLQNEMHHGEIDKLIRNLFPPATCPPESAVDYAIMDQWEREGRLSIHKVFVTGSAPDLVAPKIYAKLI